VEEEGWWGLKVNSRNVTIKPCVQPGKKGGASEKEGDAKKAF